MIVTITLNPSIDRRYFVDNFKKDEVFRAKESQQTPGGKGLNVAKVVKYLNESVMTTGFLGGKSGKFIKEGLDELEIKNSFVKIKGETRSCIAVLSDDGSQTEILESGPEILKEELEEFYDKYDEMLDKASIICASGSIPKKVPINVYKELIIRAKRKNVKFILDTSKDALKQGIKAAPYLIKPNKEELEAMTGIKILAENDLINCVKKLTKSGIEIVVVSLGREGSIVIHKNAIFKVKVPKIKTINPVGSGDSMVAGFLVALKRGYDFKKMLAFASACGTANAMEKETGMVKIQNVKKIMEEIKIEEI